MTNGLVSILGLALAVMETAVVVPDAPPRLSTFVGRLDIGKGADRDLIVAWGPDGRAFRLPLVGLPRAWADADLRPAVVTGFLVEVHHHPVLIVETIEEPR